VRIVSLVEGSSLTGPIRPLLAFSRHVREAPFVSRVQHSVITTQRRQGGRTVDSEFLSAARAQGTAVSVVPERWALDWSIVPRVRQLLSRLRPDVVETHSFKPHFVASLLQRQLPLSVAPKWVAFHHGYTSETLKVGLYNQFDRWSLPRADRVITLCRPFADHLVMARGVKRERIVLIKNAMDSRPRASAAEVDALRTEFEIDRDEHVVLCVGRLSAEKGHAELIAAFNGLVREQPEYRARLIIVGDGIERAKLQRAALPSGDRVIFAGHRGDVWSFYGLASVFVLPSHSEGSPMVLLEAMMAGVPIIASEVGGIPEILTNGVSAILVPPRDPATLQQAMRRLRFDRLQASALAMAATARLADFSVPGYVQSLLGIYDQLLSRPTN
jgi:glycosyltransferase involved in cell wall biosynthesis